MGTQGVFHKEARRPRTVRGTGPYGSERAIDWAYGERILSETCVCDFLYLSISLSLYVCVFSVGIYNSLNIINSNLKVKFRYHIPIYS